MALSEPQEQLKWTHSLSTGSDGLVRTTRTTQMDSQTKHRVRSPCQNDKDNSDGLTN